jgi:hypothetical protein
MTCCYLSRRAQLAAEKAAAEKLRGEGADKDKNAADLKAALDKVRAPWD